MYELQKIILTREVSGSFGEKRKYQIDVMMTDEQGEEKWLHYDDPTDSALYDMRIFIQLNIRRAEEENAKRLVFYTGENARMEIEK